MKSIRKLVILTALFLPVALSTSGGSFESAQLLATTENYDVFIGDTIDVKTRRLEYNGDHKDVFGLIFNPRGDSFQGKSFTITEPGLYKVVYEAYFGHHKEQQVINYLCKRKSSDFFSITNPVSISYGEYRYNTPAYHHEGVLIDAKNGTEIRFNEALSVDDFLVDQTQSDPTSGYKDRNSTIDAHSLIDFLIDPSVYMSTDFTAMTIRLTDSIDSSNYVDIKIEDGYYTGSYDSGSLSWVRVGASCNWQLGWEWEKVEGKINQGKYHNGRSGTGLNLSYRGQPYNNQIFSAQILYCSETQRFYNYRGSLETDFAYFINELSDPIVYGNNAWNGFESGKFFLTIIPTAFSNSTGRILIKSVGKYLLNDNIIADNDAPTINVDTQGYDTTNLPRAVVGRRYPVFKANVFDNYDSNLTYDVNVSYRDSVNKKDIDVPISNDSFLANKSGVYTIKYNAKDRSGNVADTISLKVITVGTFDDVVLNLATSGTTVDAYEIAQIPSLDDVHSDGGIGNISLTRKVIDPNGNEVVVDGNEFRPTLVGNYRVVYTGTDYIGNTGEVIFTVESRNLLAPKFISKPNLPPALIKGFKYSFDNIEAIKTVNNKVEEVVPEILINDNPQSGKYTAEGTQTKITYKAGDTTKDVYLDVVDVTDSEGGFDQAKYFHSATIGAAQSSYLDNPNVTLSIPGAAATQFINELNPENFYLGMSLISGESHLNIIRVKLIDSVDQNVTVTFEINLSDGTIQAPYLPILPFEVNGEKVALEYKDQNKSFLDTNQNSLGTIIKDDTGAAFIGFNRGLYLEIQFDEVSSTSSIAIEKICNQPLGYRNKGKDRVEPSIKYNSALISEQQKGKDFVYPTFEAFDVLSDITSTSISISRPGATPITGSKNMTTTFKIEQAGEYRITYTAKDSSNITKTVIEIVSVYDDIKPTLVVNNPPKDSYKLNESFTIPSYTANDESGIYTVDVILIMPTNEMRILTHHIHIEDEEVDYVEYALDLERGIYDSNFIVNNTTFRLNMAGTYRLRFVAYDAAYSELEQNYVGAYNTTSVEYSFKVK